MIHFCSALMQKNQRIAEQSKEFLYVFKVGKADIRTSDFHISFLEQWEAYLFIHLFSECNLTWTLNIWKRKKVRQLVPAWLGTSVPFGTFLVSGSWEISWNAGYKWKITDLSETPRLIAGPRKHKVKWFSQSYTAGTTELRMCQCLVLLFVHRIVVLLTLVFCGDQLRDNSGVRERQSHWYLSAGDPVAKVGLH